MDNLLPCIRPHAPARGSKRAKRTWDPGAEYEVQDIFAFQVDRHARLQIWMDHPMHDWWTFSDPILHSCAGVIAQFAGRNSRQVPTAYPWPLRVSTFTATCHASDYAFHNVAVTGFQENLKLDRVSPMETQHPNRRFQQHVSLGLVSRRDSFRESMAKQLRRPWKRPVGADALTGKTIYAHLRYSFLEYLDLFCAIRRFVNCDLI